MSSRRGLLVAGGGLLLGGCGFRPLYAPVTAADGSDSAMTAELASVRVSPMYERFGQLMRRSLMRRLEDAAPGTPARYVLTVAITQGYEVEGYRKDGTITRVRVTATGTWDLATYAVPPRTVARSTIPARTIDSFNIPDLQFFSADSAREAMDGRLIDQLTQDIVRQVAMALRREKSSGAAPA